MDSKFIAAFLMRTLWDSCGVLLIESPLLLHSSPRSIDVSRRRILHFEFTPEGALDPRLSWFESPG